MPNLSGRNADCIFCDKDFNYTYHLIRLERILTGTFQNKPLVSGLANPGAPNLQVIKDIKTNNSGPEAGENIFQAQKYFTMIVFMFDIERVLRVISRACLFTLL